MNDEMYRSYERLIDRCRDAGIPVHMFANGRLLFGSIITPMIVSQVEGVETNVANAPQLEQLLEDKGYL